MAEGKPPGVWKTVDFTEALYCIELRIQGVPGGNCQTSGGCSLC
jgi:hypothetical protein